MGHVWGRPCVQTAKARGGGTAQAYDVIMICKWVITWLNIITACAQSYFRRHFRFRPTVMEGSGKQTWVNTTKMELSTCKSCHFNSQVFGKVRNIVTEMIWGGVLRKLAAI